jgi:hypothetical protein
MAGYDGDQRVQMQRRMLDAAAAIPGVTAVGYADRLPLSIGGIGAVLAYLLGWHWEFLPSFFAKLVPGVDLVPFWTLSAANVYRKSRKMPVMIEANQEEPARTDPNRS